MEIVHSYILMVSWWLRNVVAGSRGLRIRHLRWDRSSRELLRGLIVVVALIRRQVRVCANIGQSGNNKHHSGKELKEEK